MNKPDAIIRLPLILVGLSLAGCTPTSNDGGPPPAGIVLEFSTLALPEGTWCSLGERAVLVDDAASIDDLLEDCESDSPTLGEELEATLADLAEDDALLFVGFAYGGCVESVDIPRISLDGDVLRPWLLEDDRSHGAAFGACNDLGMVSFRAFVVEEAAFAVSAELAVGTWNSNLPGSPYQAHDMEAPE